MSDIDFNIRGLEQFLKALKRKPPTVRVGILSNSPRRPKGAGKGSPTNAEIGAVHEFGAPARNIPQRSFLRGPIADRLDKELSKSGAFDPDALGDVLKQGSMTPWAKKVAVVAESIVIGAFDSKGYGKWAPWKDPGYTNEGGTLLIDTGQLRDSITSDVTD